MPRGRPRKNKAEATQAAREPTGHIEGIEVGGKCDGRSWELHFIADLKKPKGIEIDGTEHNPYSLSIKPVKAKYLGVPDDDDGNTFCVFQMNDFRAPALYIESGGFATINLIERHGVDWFK
jgi:hypothetical protein